MGMGQKRTASVMVRKITILMMLLMQMAAAECARAQYAMPRDPNEQLDYMTDYQWNRWNHGFVLNGKFIKNSIGIDLRYVRVGNPQPMIYEIGQNNDSVRYTGEPYRNDSVKLLDINGFKCSEISFYEQNYPNLVSLEQIRKKYCPEVKGRVVYMINKFFIMDHEDLYRIEGMFIYKVETVSSKDIKSLADLPEFTVIRIFTRTSRNVFLDKLDYDPPALER